MKTSERDPYDLVVIGMGMAGMSAALFAASRGLSVVHAGRASELSFASGLMDVMAIPQLSEGRVFENPDEAIKKLKQVCPDHPYNSIPGGHIMDAMDELTDALGKAGLSYESCRGRNRRLVTSMGTVKTSWGIPRTMNNGVLAYQKKAPAVILNIKGLKGFSGSQIREMIKPWWPDIRVAEVEFPESYSDELYAEHMARQIENPGVLKAFADVIRPYAEAADFIGLPPILGIYSSEQVQNQLEELVGVPVFEIPSMPPSVPGLRLREAFEKILGTMPVRRFTGKTVEWISQESDGLFSFSISDAGEVFRSRGVILASGRFMGKGLRADRDKISETLLGLPVCQPDVRSDWYEKEFYASAGHNVNLAGIVTDHRLRPVDADGNPVYRNVFAAGSILAGQDWKRMKCGTGLSVATAYEAVNHFISGSGETSGVFEIDRKAS